VRRFRRPRFGTLARARVSASLAQFWNMLWHTSKRQLQLDRTLVMGILNVTPDSFSDGGKFSTLDAALGQAERMINEGADILDVGGESTRPGSKRISPEEEIERTAPIIEAISKRFDLPVSIDTSKSKVAEAAVNAGAGIINDVSGLTWDAEIARIAAKYQTGLVLMHLRGTFETMHSLAPVENILQEVARGFRSSIETAVSAGVSLENIALDIGIGFSKTFEQNLELLAKLGKLKREFAEFPILVGTSRKSFLGKILGDVPPEKRLSGSVASAIVAVMNGANIVRVHDVKETADALRVAEAIKWVS
jgi:dihydropteroate synthase